MVDSSKKTNGDLRNWVDRISYQAITPCALVAIRWFGRDDGSSQSNILTSPSDKGSLPTRSSKVLLAIITVSSVVALSPPYMGSSAFALCLCNILLVSLAYTLLEDVMNSSDLGIYDTVNGHAMPSGLSSPRRLDTNTSPTHVVSQNLSASIALGCAVASILLENHRVNGLTYRRELNLVGRSWKRDMRQLEFGQGFLMCLVGALKGYLTISAVSRNLSIGSAESLGCSSCCCRSEATCVVSPDVLKLALIPGVWV